MKTIKYLIIFTLSLFVMNSCEEEGVATSDIDYVAFETNPLKLVVNKNESNNIDVSLYTTKTFGSERTINIYVDLDQTTADAAAYTVPTSVTIPANTNVGTFNINVNDTNLSESGEVLVINFEMEEGVYTSAEFSLDIALFCPVNLDDFVGVYEGETPYGPTQIVTSLNANGQLEITGMSVAWMTGFWGEVITDQTTLLMDVDIATGNFTIAQAYYMQTTYGGDVQAPYDLVATGNLNACALSMSINVNLIQDGFDLGAYLSDNDYDSLRENVTVK